MIDQSKSAAMTQQIIAALTGAFKAPINDPAVLAALGKATFNQPANATTGINYYDLEAGAKLLYPVLTPLRNIIPRVSGKGGIQANWRAITAVNSAGMRAGVSDGNRSGVIAVSTADYTAAYKGLGLESNVTFEAQYAGQGFDDVRALAAKTLLEALMIQEEITILGGNGAAVALGTTPTPTLADLATGGTLAFNTTYQVVCVALTLDGYLNATVAGGIQAEISRTNADGSVDSFGGGAAQKSATASITTANDLNNTHRVSATVAAVTGAVAYAWFLGTGGTQLLAAITTINSVVLSAAAAGTQTAASLPAADWSKNALVFDGLLYQAWKTGSNAYQRTLATGTAGTGTPLTSDAAGGIVEIDTMLKAMWDNYRLTPETIWVNSQEALNISKKIVAGNSSAAQRFTINVDQGMLAGGIMVRSYLNRFSMSGASEIPIRIHPNLPPGTLLATTNRLPYPMSNVANVFQIRERQSYYQIEWPLRSRKYEYGVYCDEVLQHYFPPSMGIINNIADG